MGLSFCGLRGLQRSRDRIHVSHVMSTPTRVGSVGSTNVLMLVTPGGPKNSSRLEEASQ